MDFQRSIATPDSRGFPSIWPSKKSAESQPRTSAVVSVAAIASAFALASSSVSSFGVCGANCSTIWSSSTPGARSRNLMPASERSFFLAGEVEASTKSITIIRLAVEHCACDAKAEN